MAARNPSDRSVIAIAAWSSFAHGAVMAVVAVHLPNERGDLLVAAAAFGVIGEVMTVLAPAKQAAGLASTSGQAIGLYFIARCLSCDGGIRSHTLELLPFTGVELQHPRGINWAALSPWATRPDASISILRGIGKGN